jgi:predicted RNase H-like nuclease (RuvC/YqgF family)
MPKPNLGKTQTIKKRAIYVYLPSEEMAEKWKRTAKENHISVSKFVIECVQEFFAKDRSDFVSRRELVEKVKKLEEEIKELRKENRLLKSLVDKLDEELRRYRVKPFLDDDFVGVREYSRELVEIFKMKGFVEYDELYSLLNVDPRDTELVKGYVKQIEALKQYGLIEVTPRGWRWKG